MPDWSFKIFVCGARGGMFNGDTTSFFIAAEEKPNQWLALDAGSNMDCLREYFLRHPEAPMLYSPGYTRTVGGLTQEAHFRQHNLIGFLVTHAHLDHLSGLIVSSADEMYGAHKPVFGLTSVNDGIKDIFKIPSWPGNFGWYDFIDLAHGAEYELKDAAATIRGRYPDHGDGQVTKTWLSDSPLKVTPFTLDHGGEVSTAFYIDKGDASLLFMGDTGPDHVKHFDGTFWTGTPERPIELMFKTVTPEIESGKLKTIMIECSYPNPKDNKDLFGHLTPGWLIKHLKDIAKEWKRLEYTTVRHINIILIHIKPTLMLHSDSEPRPRIGEKDNEETQGTIDLIVEQLKQKTQAMKERRTYRDLSLTWDFRVPYHNDILYINKATPFFQRYPWEYSQQWPVNIADAIPVARFPDRDAPLRPLEPLPHDGDFMRFVKYYDDGHGHGATDDGVYHVVMYTEITVLAALVMLLVCVCGIALGWVCRDGSPVAKYIKTEREQEDE